ncbi:MAG: DNA primase [Paracoccaceae bacterium]
MDLAPFLDDLRARLRLSDVVGRKVVWDKGKSQPAKGDMWAPCPFHQEKTASFHVLDAKGFYYCFGCHAKGDLFEFVKRTEQVEFMDAVKILAEQAGMQMPARDPQAAQRQDRAERLRAVMEAAQRHYALQLSSSKGTAARDYLAGRGLDAEACRALGLGFAPPGWDGLREALTAKGTPVQDLLDCGLVKASDKGRAPYDVFRDRILFPIRDVRGRVISFGGRAMDPSDGAKYLNGPQTALFDKGKQLYNHGPARDACAAGAPLLVAEGYMDAIALSRAGFPGTVAPLGTAVTEDQLRLMWRMADEPVVALDGDAAGRRAAMRMVDLAIPLLAPGKSLRFAMLPAGQDPDDLLRARGPEAMQALIDDAVPLVRMLWEREVEGRDLSAPERRAALEADLRDATARIADPIVRRHYGDALYAMRREAFFAPNAKPQPRATAAAAASPLLADGAGEALAELAILATVLAHPAILTDCLDEIDALTCEGPVTARLRDAIVGAGPRPDLRAHVAERMVPPLDEMLSHPHLRVLPSLRPRATAEFALSCVRVELARLDMVRGHRREVARLTADMTERDAARLRPSTTARWRADGLGPDEGREWQTAPNGARVERQDADGLAAALAAAGRKPA